MASHAALWSRNATQARRALASLDGMQIGGRLFDADRRALQAGIAALEGDSGEAAGLFAQATRALRELGLPFALALTDLDVVATLGTGESPGRAAADEARDIITRLGATSLLVSLEGLIAGEGSPARTKKVAGPAARTAVTSSAGQSTSSTT